MSIWNSPRSRGGITISRHGHSISAFSAQSQFAFTLGHSINFLRTHLQYKPPLVKSSFRSVEGLQKHPLRTCKPPISMHCKLQSTRLSSHLLGSFPFLCSEAHPANVLKSIDTVKCMTPARHQGDSIRHLERRLRGHMDFGIIWHGLSQRFGPCEVIHVARSISTILRRTLQKVSRLTGLGREIIPRAVLDSGR